MEILELFIRRLASKKDSASKNTIKNYLADVKHFINWYEKSLKSVFEANLVTPDIISLYEKSMGGIIDNSSEVIQSRLGASSMKRHISSLRKFFSVLKQEGAIQKNPFDEIEVVPSAIPTDYWHLRSFKDQLIFDKASKITIKSYVSDIIGFAKWYEQAILPSLDNPLTSAGGFYLITQNILDDYKNRLIEVQNAAPRTVNRKLSALRKYLDFAAKKGFINISELRLDPYRESERKTIEENEPQIKLAEVKPQDEITIAYSSFPPIRLIQRLIVSPYLQLEDKTASIIASIITGKPVEGLQKLPKSVYSELKKKNILRNQNLNVSSLLAVNNVQKDFYQPNKVSLLGQPLYKKAIHHIRFTRPAWYHKYHNYAFVHYAHFALLIIFASGVGVALYNNLVSQKQEQASAAPTAPPRILSFQGRLTDNLDNPITSPTDIRFLIYNDPSSSGSALLWQEVHYLIAPDQDGIFSILLGDTTTIPASVFTDNSSLYLGVAIKATSELTPRQRIASVGYATNSEFLQGLPPTTQAGITSYTNVVLALDSSGNLTLADTSSADHAFRVTNGQFSLSGQTSLLLTTNTGTNSNVVVSPDGLGKVDLQKGLVNNTNFGNLAPGAVEVNDKFAVLATESAVAAFVINNNSTGGDIFTASSSGTTRLTIQNDGRLVSGFYNGQNGVLFGTYTTGIIDQAITSIPNLCLQSGASNPTWGACGGAGYWNISNGSIKPINDTLDVLFGGQSTGSAKFRFLNVNTGTPVASVSANSGNNAIFMAGDGTIGTTNRQSLTLGNSSNYNTTGNILINPNGIGKIGIFTPNPLASFDLRGLSGTQVAASISANTTAPALLIDNSGSGDFIAASKGGQIYFRVNANSGNYLGDDYDGELIVGKNGQGKITSAIVDPVIVSNQKTTGTQSLTFHTSGATNADFIFSNVSTELSRLTQAGQYQLPIAGSTGGIVLGTDAQLFRGAANRLDLASGDSFNVVSGNYQVGGVTVIDSSSNATFGNVTVTGTCTGCISSGNSPFQLANGIILANNSTADFGIGGQGTSSAKFAVLNINSGTPTASVSSGTNGAGSYIDANGNFATVKKQTLTLGSTTTGNIAIGTDPTQRALTIGNQTGASSLTLDSGTGAINIGTSIAKAITIGNTTGASALNLNAGTGSIALNSNSTGDITLNSSDQLLLDSVGILELNSSAGIISIGNDSINQNINIGTGGSRSIAIGNTNANTAVSVNSGGSGVINVTSASNLYLDASGFLELNSSSGPISIGNDAVAQAINIGNGSAARTITIGNVTGATALELALGTGGINIGDGTPTKQIDIGGNDSSASDTVRIATNSTAADTISIGNANASTTLGLTGGTAWSINTSGTISSASTTGVSLSGSDADIIFSGTSNHDISASSGTLRLGALTLTGAVTGNSQDITGLTNLSAGGTITFSALNGQNAVLYGTQTTGVLAQAITSNPNECLISGASSPTWGSCVSPINSPFKVSNGAIVQNNTTLDFLIGSESTSSAKFAVLNVNAGTPTASVSAGTSGGFYITASGSLATTAKQTLTLGATTTGNIAIGTDSTDRSISIGNITGATALNLLTGTGGINIGDGTPTKTVDIGGNDLSAADTIRIATNSTSADTISIGNANASTTLGLTGGTAWSINTSGTISSASTTGISLSGNDADMTFSGSSNHDISASSGTLRLGAATLTGSITGGSQSITALSSLTINGGGSINSATSGTLDIGTSNTTTITLGRVGQGITLPGFTNQNGVLYGTQTTGVLAQATTSNPNECLLSGASNPTWGSCVNPTNSPFKVSNGAIVQNNTTLDLLIGSESTSSAKFAVLNVNGPGGVTATVSGNLIVQALNGSGGFVGIGTDHPSAPLHVARIATSDPLAQFSSAQAASIYITGGSGSQKLWVSDGVDNFLTGTTAGDSGIYFNLGTDYFIGEDTKGPRLMIQGTSGNIGIGTVNPSSHLEITRDLSRPVTGKALVSLNQLENQDIFTASASGTTRFVINNSGNIAASGLLQIGSTTATTYSRLGTGATTHSLSGANSLLVSGAIEVDGNAWFDGNITISGTCTGCGTGAFDVLSTGVTVQKNQTTDFLIGSSATTSAKFAVLNVNTGTPVASVSSGLLGNGMSFDANGNITTANKRTLTLGGGTSGNILIQGNGNTSIADGIVNLTGTNPTFGATGTNTITINGNSTGNIQFFSSSNTLTSAGALTIASNATINGTTIQLANGSAGTIQTTGNQNLTLTAGSGTINLNTVSNGAVTTGNGLTTLGGNLTVAGATTTFSNVSPVITSGTDTTLTITPNGTGNLNLTGDYNSQVLIGSSGTTTEFPLFINNGIGNNASLAINNPNNGDLLVASASGTTRFRLANDGSIIIRGGQTSDIDTLTATTLNIGATNTTTISIGRSGQGITIPGFSAQNGVLFGTYTTGVLGQATTSNPNQCLLSGASNPTWGSCVNSANTPFQVLTGAIIPVNSTLDTLLGGQSSASATFKVTGKGNPFAGTQVAASISANTSAPALLIDNSGTGDFLAASKGGQIYFRVNANSGNYLGDDYDGELIVGKNGQGKITSAIVDPIIVSNQKTTGTQSLTFHTSGATNADFQFLNQSTTLSTLTQAGQFQLPITGSTGGIVLGGDTQIFRGAANRIDVGTGDSFNIVSGSILINNSTVIDSSGNGTFGTLSVTGGCTGCVTASNSPFQISTGAIVPVITSTDFLIGAQSTASAKFAILNVSNSSTPTASVSAQNAGGQALVLGGDGTIQSVRKNTLTLGGTSTGNIAVGTDSNARGIFIGNTTGTSSLTLDSGTGAISIGTSIAKAITIGNTTGASALNLNAGTGSITLTSNSTGDITLSSSDQITLDSVGVLELNSTGGAISIGNDADNQNINIGTAGSRSIAIGSTTPNTGLSLISGGSGTIVIDSDSLMTLDSDGVLELNSSAGAISIGNDADAQAINIGNGAAARTITIGNVTGATALELALGTGGINIGDGTPTKQIDIGGNDSSASDTVRIATNSTAADTISIGNANASTTLGLTGGTAWSINTTGTLTSASTTGISLTGSDSDIIFSGTLTHDISASSGTLRLGAFTLNGAVTGNSQNVTGLANLSASGTITFSGFSGANNGGVIYANSSGVLSQSGAGTTGQCLIGGATPSFGSCATGVNASPFQVGNGAIVQGNTTLDFLIGSQSTSSAKFAVLNVDSGTPTASVSAGTAGGVYITSTGNIASTAKQSLTLGATSTGNILIGTDATARTITIGNTTGASALSLNAGSGAIDIGTDSTGKSISIGGTGANTIALANTQTGGSLSIGTALTTGTITLGGTSTTGTITIGQSNSASANILNLGTGTGSTTINIGSGATNAKTINIGSGAVANAITLGGTGANTIALGNTQTAGTIALGSAMTSGSITIGGAVSSTTSITVGQSTGAQTIGLGVGTGGSTINIGTGATTGKNINIGTANVANIIAIGTSNASSTLSLTGGPSWSITTGGNISGAGILQIGSATGTTYSRLGTNTTGHSLSGANNLLLSGNLEVDGTAYFDGNITVAGTCTGCGSLSPFTNSTGAIYAVNTTQDFLIGGQSTSSARFSISNLNGSAGSIPSWSNTTDTGLSGQLEQFGLVYLNGYIYHVGGYDGPTVLDTVRYARVKSDGTLDNWVVSPNTLPEARLWHGTVTVNGYIYAIGGHSSVATPTNPSVYYAKVNADGTVGTWGSTTSIPSPRIRLTHSVVAANGYIYVVGGENSSAQSTVWYTKVNPDGTVGPWQSATSLPVATSDQAVVVDNGYIYSMGGLAPSATSAIYYAKINQDGSLGAWIGNSTGLSSADTMHSGIAVNGYVYILGGINNSTTVYYAKFNSDGSIPTFSTNPAALPESHQGSGITYANGYIYISGGFATDNIAYGSITRVSIAGNLDLLGLTSTSLASSSGFSGGGSIFAGQIFSKGLEVSGSSNIWGNLSVSNTLSAGALSISGKITGKALAILNEIGNQDIFTASSSGVARFSITNAGGIKLASSEGISGQCIQSGGTGAAVTWGTCGGGSSVFNLANGVITAGNQTADFLWGSSASNSARFHLFGSVNAGTNPVASISGNTTGPALLVNNDNTLGGDLIVASYAGQTKFRLFRDLSDPLHEATITLGETGLGKMNALDYDPPYTIDGLRYSTYSPSTFLPTEEYTGKAVLSYDPTQGAYVKKLDFNNFTYQSDLWVFNRIIDPEIGNIKVFVTPNSAARTWYKKDGTNRTITLYSDRPVEISYRLTANRVDYKKYATVNPNGPQGLVVPPPPNPTGDGSNDNNLPSDPYFDTLTINWESGKWVLKDFNNNNINQVEAFSKAIIANIQAGLVNAQKIVVGDINATTGFVSNLSGNTLSIVTATFNNISSSVSNLGTATASSLALTTNNFTIAGQNINSYIQNAVNTYLAGQIISPVGEISNVKTNVISPLADSSAPSISLQNSRVSINNGSQTVAWFDKNGNASISGNLIAKNISSENASVSGTLATSNIQTTDASVSGTLRTTNLIADNIQGLDDKIGTLAAVLNGSYQAQSSGSGEFSQIFANLVNAGTITADFGIFEEGITSMGPITASDITAIETLAVGTNFTISNNAINTLGAELALQSLRQADISFEGGLIRMDTDGNMSIAGNLNLLGEIDAAHGVFAGTLTSPALATSIISPLPGDDLTIHLTDKSASDGARLRITNSQNKEVLSINNKGDILSSGSATLSKLNFNLVGQAQATSLSEATATGSAGFATLKAHQPELTIKNPNVTKDSLIYITPFGDTNGKVLYLLRQIPSTNTEDGSFTVGLSGGTSITNIQFNWLIVN